MEQTVSLADLYRELKKIEQVMVTKAELNNFVETVAVLSNEQTMNQIQSSEADISSGRTKKIVSVHDI